MEADRVLLSRVEALDADDRPWAVSPGVAGLVEHATSVLSARTGDVEAIRGQVLDPDAADQIVATSSLIASIRRDRPELVAGPLQRQAQLWVGTARHGPLRADQVLPARTDARPKAKPFGIGLFTSSADVSGRSPWLAYLAPYQGSDLFPLPWTRWLLTVPPTARVREVASAAAWTELLAAYPRRHEDAVYPDWVALSSDVDGVHVTIAAAAAIDGMSLRTPAGPSAPAHWDVESTFWLRWSFETAVQLDRP